MDGRILGGGDGKEGEEWRKIKSVSGRERGFTEGL